MLESIIHQLEMDVPPTVMGNVAAIMGLYIICVVGGFMCLKYLHKEDDRRREE